MELSGPRGTHDILPDEVVAWQYVEEVVRSTFERHGYYEMRLPIFEHTEVFARGVGETTDIVQKEMYTFSDRSGRSLTLRPEGTAQVVRAYIERNLHSWPQPVKTYYIGPMFRYERPQKGRYRQFHQFGAEALGSGSPLLDVELIAIPIEIYRTLGLDKFTVHVNSIGCPTCRPQYRERLRAHLQKGFDRLCPSCQERIERNPLRVLDCKNEGCRAVAAGHPVTYEHLCDECEAHFTEVKSGLDGLGLEYVVDGRLVRGLDYYTRTVFELISEDLGAQDALGGGGRYDGLVEQCGGPPTPSVGFAAGMERILLVLRAHGLLPERKTSIDVYIACAGEGTKERALPLAFALRKSGLRTELDYLDRSLRAQMRAAQRAEAAYVLILGEEELAASRVVVKHMDSGEQTEVPLDQVVEWLEGKVHA